MNLSPTSLPRRVNLTGFLAFVVIMQFSYPVTDYGAAATVIYMAAYAGMVYFGVSLVGHADQLHTRLLAGLGVVMFLAAMWFGFHSANGLAEVAMLITVGLFQIALMGSLLSYMFTPDTARLRLDLVLSALSTYILIGGVFSVVFNLLELLSPGTFLDQVSTDTAVDWQTLIYASYSTLTTLGFGDVVAVNPWGRSLMTLEAVIGVLFLATIIAQLVSAPDVSPDDPIAPGEFGPLAEPEEKPS